MGLTKEAKKTYLLSWIYQYFNCHVTSLNEDSSVVIFCKQNGTKDIFNNSRFKIFVKLPENSKQFFKSQNELESLKSKTLESGFIPAEMLSGVLTGLNTQGNLHSKSPYYKAPYMLVFRTQQQGIQPNFLAFNDFLKPQTSGNVLALLNYDDNTDRFVISHSYDICLPYLKTLSLPAVLEFYITDSNAKQVQFKDMSQLFISLTIIK
jgi:hypothetical protein